MLGDLDSLLNYLVMNVGLLLLIATVLTEVRPLRSLLKRQVRNTKNQLCLGVIFGLLAISSTYTGLEFRGAVVNTRVISTVAAGLAGGPLSGITAGIIGGIHRYLYNPSGFTSVACAWGTFSFGIIGAVCHRWFARLSKKNLHLIMIVMLSELFQCLILFALCRPIEDVFAIEKVILLPKMIVNSLGLIVFMGILNRLHRDLTFELAEQQAAALYIAQKCLPFLRYGMNDTDSMQKAVDTVRRSLPNFIVAISDREKILASGGISLKEQPLPLFVKKAVTMQSTSVVRDCRAEKIFESYGLEDTAAIAVPLIWDKEAVGALILVVPMGPNLFLEADILTAESLAMFFSSMLELGELQHQIDLRRQAEFKALQSQINPHFLFNALNTISALCLTNPERARETILVLANYFRQTLSINEQFVTLEQELSNVDNYLFLTEARFEGAIHVTKTLPDDLTRLYLPPLILQPVVENAVRHGGIAVDNRCVDIKITQDKERAYISVSDKGSGFPREILEEIEKNDSPRYTGLFNVRKRLNSIYGADCEFKIESSDNGSTVYISIPLLPPKYRENSVEGGKAYANSCYR